MRLLCDDNNALPLESPVEADPGVEADKVTPDDPGLPQPGDHCPHPPHGHGAGQALPHQAGHDVLLTLRSATQLSIWKSSVIENI